MSSEETSISPDISFGNSASLTAESRMFSLLLLCIASIIGLIIDNADSESVSDNMLIISPSKSRVTMASKTAPEALCFNEVTALST